MSDDYHEDDLDPQMPSNYHQLQTTSATLNRLSSLYHLLSHPPSHLSTQSYWIPISKSLIKIILPTFFNLDQPHDRIAKPDPFKLAPDPLRRAACYVLGQTIVHQLDVYKSFISPIIHLAFRPSCTSDEPVDSIIISSSQILYTVQLLNQLILNSDPSHTLVDRLILPILPQLLSLTVFLFKTKADPFLRQQIESLLDIWIKFNDAEIVAELLKKSVREIELGRELNIKHFQDKTQIDWSRDDEGMACIKLKNKREEESIEIRPDLDGLAKWLQAQKSQAFIGTLLVKWFNELELLRNRTGFLEAKMTLIRMQLILKIIEVFDSSTIHDPVQMLNFIKHTFSSLKDDAHFNRNRDSDDLNSSAPFEAHSSTLHSLKILGVTKVKTQEEDDDMSQGILLTGLSLLSAVVEANPDMNEQNTPPLKEITVDIDHLLTNSSALNPELQELGIRCRLMLSVRKALAEVPHHTDKVDSELEEEKNQLTKKYSEGLKLVEDECLPLRSQGIVMLKEVLLAQPKSTEAKKLIEAWTKGVIEIFLRMIEEEDSFVYLNAIKGLSGIAERWSHLVCDRLNAAYGDGLKDYPEKLKEGSEGSKRDIDRWLRVGETMVQVIQRAGIALTLYVNRLLPSVFFILHSKAFPIALRSSALAILTSCVEVSLCTMASYLPDLIESCLTILSIESLSPSTNHEPNAEWSLEPNNDELFEYGEQFKELGKDEMADPTIRDSRHPVLRRSAIKFLRMAFLKSLNSPIEDYNKRMKSRVMIRAEDLMKVMRVLGYVKLIEKDGVCKALAEEFHEELESTFFK